MARKKKNQTENTAPSVDQNNESQQFEQSSELDQALAGSLEEQVGDQSEPGTGEQENIIDADANQVLSQQGAEIDALIQEQENAPLEKATVLPEAELHPSIATVKEYLETVSNSIPLEPELARLNGRVRDSIYAILELNNVEFASTLIGSIASMASEYPRFVFDTPMLFQHIEKFRWAPGMRFEYESILATICKMRYWETAGDAGSHGWEQLNSNIRPAKAEQYMRVIKGAIGMQS